MKHVALALGLCALVASGGASAAETCKAKAIQEKLSGEALLDFVKECETEALLACGNQAADKPDSDAYMNACVAKAEGTGPVHRRVARCVLVSAESSPANTTPSAR